MMQVTKVWWDGEKLMAEPIDPTTIYQEPAQKPQRWAVFCQGCRKEWSVSYPHPGKDICVDCDDKPAQQEPVAHRDGFWCADLTCKKCYSADFRFKHKNSVVNESLTTPAQRTWVGLTDEEIVAVRGLNIQGGRMRPYAFARAIEAKLKEKNT
jgi:hypothetical protein